MEQEPFDELEAKYFTYVKDSEEPDISLNTINEGTKENVPGEDPEQPEVIQGSLPNYSGGWWQKPFLDETLNNNADLQKYKDAIRNRRKFISPTTDSMTNMEQNVEPVNEIKAYVNNSDDSKIALNATNEEDRDPEQAIQDALTACYRSWDQKPYHSGTLENNEDFQKYKDVVRNHRKKITTITHSVTNLDQEYDPLDQLEAGYCSYVNTSNDPDILLNTTKIETKENVCFLEQDKEDQDRMHIIQESLAACSRKWDQPANLDETFDDDADLQKYKDVIRNRRKLVS